MAFPNIATGSYSGNGTSQTVTVGFQPDLVIVKAPAVAGQDTYFCTKDMAANFSMPVRADGAHVTTAITSLTATGFSVGAHLAVNTNAATNVYLAIKDNGANVMNTITYTGDNTDDKLIFTNFVPDYALLKSDSAITGAQKFATQASALSNTASNIASVLYAGGADRSELIGFLPGGMYVSKGNAGNLVNVAATVHYGFALKTTSGVVSVFTYTGNGTNNFAPVSMSFTPAFVNLRRADAGNPVTVYNTETAGNAQPFDATLLTGQVNSLTSTGFQVGTDASANNTGSTYWGMAIAAFTPPTDGSSGHAALFLLNH